MSYPEDNVTTQAPDAEAFERLEEAVHEAVTQLRELRARLQEARAEGREMKELLRQFTEGEEDPSRLLTRLETLEAENLDLLERLKRGRESVERLLARIRFLEEQG